MGTIDWGRVGRYALAVSCGFGLGTAYTAFGFGAGVLFWLVMFLIVIVKIVVINTYTAVRDSNKQWKSLLAERPSEDRVSRRDDRTRPWQHPQTERQSPPR